MSLVSTASIKDTPTRLAIQKLANKLDQDQSPTFAGLTLSKDDASSSLVTDLLTLEHTTSGTPAAGIGTGLVFKVEDLGGSEEQASIDVLLTTVTNGSEDADMVFSVNKAGTITEIMRIDSSAGALDISGKVTVGSFGSPVDVTSAGKYGFELHWSGNDYDVTGIRSRASLITTDVSTRTAEGALLQAANSDGISASVLNGALIEAIGKSTTAAATISTMRGLLVGAEWSAKDTITDLRTLHVRTHTRDSATEGYFSNSGYGIYLENEAVGGNGQALDAGIYFKDTNISGGNKAFTYGIDFNGGTFGTAEIRFSNGETIDNLTNGQLDITGDLVVSGTLTLSTLTQGSVIFAGSGGLISQDNSNLFWDDTNDRLGIGTATPSQALDLIGSMELEDTTTSTTGVVYKGPDRFLHNFHHPTGNTAVPDGRNTFIGIDAGNFTMGSTATQTWHSSYNMAMGTLSLTSNTTGYYNVAIGYKSLEANTTGYYNAAIGYRSLASNTTGYTNMAMGILSLGANTTGYYNAAIGYKSLEANTTGYYNAAIGYKSLASNTTGYTNMAMGILSLGANTTGNYNVAIGYKSLTSNTTGNYNVAIGYNAGRGVSASNYSNNVFIGYQAGNSVTTGSDNIVIGYDEDLPAGDTSDFLNIGGAIYGDLSTNFIGFSETVPETLTEWTHATPYLTLHNSTHEDTDGGRESRLNFKGEQSGGEETTLARIEVNHDGAADDEKGKVVISTNDGNDTNAPTEALTIDSARNIKASGTTISDSSGNLTSANGASFGPAGVTSITVVNGIVTAIS